MNRVKVNGQEYTFGNDELLVIIGAELRIGSQVVTTINPNESLKIEIVGDPQSIYSSRSVDVSGSVGTIQTQGSVRVGGGVTGSVSTQGSVRVGGDSGSVNTMGSVEVSGNCKGSINTMGRITVGSRG
jgi:cytoskeletal protein CcmA (bactofilin family)